MQDIFNAYAIPENSEELQQELSLLLEKYTSLYEKKEQLKKLFGFIDYTSLNTTDTEKQIAEKSRKINDFHRVPRHIGISNLAAFVVYPKFVPIVKKHLKNKYVQIASVAAGFPASQTFQELKLKEVEMALETGASEIDVVFSVGDFLEGSYEYVFNELLEIKKATGKHSLKVILETGALIEPELIYKASVLAMEAGADFIKTSTGKGYPGASTFSAYVMSKAIRDYFELRKRRVGIKPAGGISKPQQAAEFMAIVGQVLGKQWLSKDYFRIGASRLANNILASIVQTDLDDKAPRNYF